MFVFSLHRYGPSLVLTECKGLRSGSSTLVGLRCCSALLLSQPCFIYCLLGLTEPYSTLVHRSGESRTVGDCQTSPESRHLPSSQPHGIQFPPWLQAPFSKFRDTVLCLGSASLCQLQNVLLGLKPGQMWAHLVGFPFLRLLFSISCLS